MRPLTAVKKSFFLKILCLMWLLSFVPFAALGFYSLVQVNSLSVNIKQTQIETTINNVLEQRFTLLRKEAELINTEFMKVGENLLLLQKQAEYIFAEGDNALLSHDNIRLVQSSKGYLWEKFQDPYERANVFISSISAGSYSMRDLQKAKKLEPLLKQTCINEPILKAVYFCFADSSFLIYPAMNVDYEVSIGKLPPNLDVRKYPFYYLADNLHDPKRELVWTKPYSDVTHWEMVVTATVPVYLPSGQLYGVIGADFPIKFIDDKMLNLKFKEPHAFAFIRDREGNFIAGQKNDTYGKWLMASPLASYQLPVEKTAEPDGEATNLQGIQKIATPEGNFYLLFAPIEINGWILNFVLPESEIITPIINGVNEQTSMQTQLFFQRFLFFLLLGSAIVILFSYYFSKTVTGPIKRLTKASQEIVKGNYKMHIPPTSSDEIGHLTRMFNLMNQTIDKLIDELTQRANQLEIRVLERTKALQEANLELQRTFDRLKQSEAARSELIVQVSHDLKTPLTSIKGYLQLLNDYHFAPERQKELIELILVRTHHMIQLIDDLFEISAMDLHETQFEKEWVPVDFLLDHALEIAIRNSVDENIQIRTDYQPDLPLVYADPKKLNRAFINLLSNAIKYSGGKQERRIEIRARQHDATIRIEISDNGMGISKEHIEHIFTPFYRDPRAEQARISGSGLGLSIARKIIEAHSGTIAIDSRMGEGTTVAVSLPVTNME